VDKIIMPRPKICVVGASNIDLIAYAPRLPKLGETVAGSNFQMGFGGKGANQAVMAAKLGAAVTIITKLGEDLFGQDTRKNFIDQSIDTTYLSTSADAHTGVAPIWVDESSGNNAILVAGGANNLLSPEDVAEASVALTTADIVVCQWEIRTDTVLAALRTAHAAGVTTIFNPAPAHSEIPAELYAHVDILCPNESETEQLTGMSVTTLEDAVAAAQTLLQRGPRTVILTLGERGSLLVTAEGHQHIPAPQVVAVDTTGAGDAFVGSLAYYLALGQPVAEAMGRANRIAAISVQMAGTQRSFPTLADLPADMLVE
jgi:ribokinase